jgi:hypothetical protein
MNNKRKMKKKKKTITFVDIAFNSKKKKIIYYKLRNESVSSYMIAELFLGCDFMMLELLKFGRGNWSQIFSEMG